MTPDVTVVGDSIGRLIAEQLPQFALGRTVHNKAVSSQYIEGTLYSLYDSLMATRPRFCVVQVGTNDCHNRSASIDLYTAQMKELVRFLAAFEERMWGIVCSIPPAADLSASFAAAMLNEVLVTTVVRRRLMLQRIAVSLASGELVVSDLEDGVHPKHDAIITVASEIGRIIGRIIDHEGA